jgi:hypothetical protein
MIESFRKYTGLMIVVLVLLFIGLVFLDGGSISRALGGKPVMQVGGEAISQKDYDRQMALLSISQALPAHPLPRNTKVIASHYLGDAILDPSQVTGQVTSGSILNQMATYVQGTAPERFITNRITVKRYGLEYGVRPGDDELESFVENVLFADPEGNFDQEAYDEFRKNRVSRIGGEKGFQEYVRDLLTAMNLSKIIGGGIAPEMETTRLAYDTDKQVITGKQISLDSAPLEGTIRPTQDELEAYFEENRSQYQSDELRKVTYVLIEPDWKKAADEKAKKEAEAKKAADEAKKKEEEAKKKAEEAAAKANKALEENNKTEGTSPAEDPKPSEGDPAPNPGASPTPAETPAPAPKAGETPAPAETPSPAGDPAPPEDPAPVEEGSEGDPGDPGEPAPAQDPQPQPTPTPAPAPAADPEPAPAPKPAPKKPTSLVDPPEIGESSGLDDLLKDSNKPVIPDLTKNLPTTPVVKTPKDQLNSFEKRKAVEALSADVDELYNALNENLDKDFAEVVKMNGYEVKTTDFFASNKAPEPLNASVQGSAQGGTVADEIFKLPTSGDADMLFTDPLQTEHGYVIARFEEVTEAKDLPFEEVRVKVSIDLKKQMAREKLVEQAKETRDKLLAAIDGGKSFEEAAKELELEPTDLTEINGGQQFNFQGRIQRFGGDPAFEPAKLTNPGEVAPVHFDPSEESPNKALIIFVEKREVVKDADYLNKLEEKFRFDEKLMQYIAFENWLSDRYDESDVVPPKIEGQ